MTPSYSHASKLCPMCNGTGTRDYGSRSDGPNGERWAKCRCSDGRVAVDVEETSIGYGIPPRPALWSYVFVGDPVLVEGRRATVTSIGDNGGVMLSFNDKRCGAEWELQHGRPFADLTLDLSGDFSHRDERLRP